jgi:hypothetical protein
VVAEHGGELPREGSEDGIMECTGAQGELPRLCYEGGEDLWVAVALIDRSTEGE